jgi:hypothetical protein
MTTTTQEASKLIGHDVKLTLQGDESYGLTLRWGKLREVTADGIVIDGYHDCSGIYGQYPDHKRDGNHVSLSELVRLERDWHVIA